jgi:hypothetical protein
LLKQFWIAEIIQSRAGDPDGDVVVFEFSIWDNCVENGGYLARKAIESFIANLRPDQKGARVGRQWLNLTGRVFPEWRPSAPYFVPSRLLSEEYLLLRSLASEEYFVPSYPRSEAYFEPSRLRAELRSPASEEYLVPA